MATYFKGGKQIYVTPTIGGKEIERSYQGSLSLTNPFKIGQDLGFGYVYKVFDGNSGCMVVAKNDYTGPTPPAANLWQWSNGFCGTSVPTSTTDGFGNMKSLYDLSVGGPCDFIMGYSIYDYLYVTGSSYAGEHGWYVPAENELQEVYDSGVLFYPRYTSGDGGYYFSSTGKVVLSTPRGRMLSFNTGVWTDSSEYDNDARVRLVRRV